jgi:hypothetical protein
MAHVINNDFGWLHHVTLSLLYKYIHNLFGHSPTLQHELVFFKKPPITYKDVIHTPNKFVYLHILL